MHPLRIQASQLRVGVVVAALSAEEEAAVDEADLVAHFEEIVLAVVNLDIDQPSALRSQQEVVNAAVVNPDN